MTPADTASDGAARHRRAFLSAMMASGFAYLMTAVSFVTVPLYLGWLGVDAYGRFLTLLAFMGYLNFADAGLNWGALVLIGMANGRQDRAAVASLFRHASVLAAASAFFALALCLGVYGLSRLGHTLPMFAAGPAPGTSLLLIGLKSAFMLSSSSVMAMAYGLQEGYWYTRLQGYFQLLGAALMLAAAYWMRSVDAVVAASAAASGLSCAATLWMASRRYADYLSVRTPLSLGTFKQLLRTGAKGFVLQGCRLVRTTLPIFLMASYGGTRSVPSLTLPLTLLAVVGGFLFNLSTSLQTAYGEAWARGEKLWIATSLRHLVERGLGWMLLASALILGLGQLFVSTWTAGRVGVPLAVLGSAVAITFASWMTDLCIFALVGINRQRRVALAEVANVALGALICVGLCSRGEQAYLGFGTLAAAILTTLWVGRRELHVWLETWTFEPSARSAAGLLLSCAASLACVLGARSLMEPFGGGVATWAKMGGIGVLGASVFVAGVWVCGLKQEQWPGFDWVSFLKARLPRAAAPRFT